MESRDLVTVEPCNPAVPDRNPALIYCARLQGSGRSSMIAMLRRCARDLGAELETLPWHKLRYEHVQAIISKASDCGYAPGTVNLLRVALREIARASWRLGLLDSEELQRILDVKAVRGSRLPPGKALSRGELSALFSTLADDTTPAGARDAAIMALGYGAGLRRAEIAALQIGQVQAGSDGYTLRVIGKGNKERVIFLNDGGAEALRSWISLRGDEPGPLFYAGRKGGHLLPGQGMDPGSIREIVARRAAAAGLQGVSPHDLRRSFVSDLLDAGVDISTVAGMAGHANVSTTARYDRRGDEAKRRASKALHVPYRVRKGV